MITVIIPCISTHLNKLNLGRALVSILDGTKRPDEIIIVISSLSASSCLKLWDPILNDLLKKYNIFKNLFKIIFSKKKLTCGMARQTGLNKVNRRTNIVIFCDADDTYHPQRIEIFLYFFKKYDVKAINHLFIPENYNFNNYNIERIPLLATSEKLYNHYFPNDEYTKLTCIEPYYGYFLNKTTTDGHMAIKLPITTKFYDINSGCDSSFLHKLCYSYKKNIIIGACLSKYNKAQYWLFKDLKKKEELYDSILCTEQARIKII